MHPDTSRQPRALLLVPVDADVDDDGNVDLVDFALLPGCMSGPRAIIAPPCVPADLDHDGDVDLYDFRTFQVALTGVRA